MPDRMVLLRVTVPGPPANKKNRPIPAWPWIASQRLRTHDGKPVRGLRDFLAWLLYGWARRSPGAYAMLLAAVTNLRPVIFPNREYVVWEKAAKKAILAASGGFKIESGRGRMLGVTAKFYLAPRQRPDLPGLYEAVFDALESSGAISSDYWINSTDGSKRFWPPSGSSNAVKLARESWVPRTTIEVWEVK